MRPFLWSLQRLLFAIVGLSVLAWSVWTLPIAVLTAPARDISAIFASNNSFKADALSQIAAQLHTASHSIVLPPDSLRAEAIVSFKVAEDKMERGKSEDIDKAFASAEYQIRLALQYHPVDSFLWFALYSARTSRFGFDPENTSFLSKSYSTGPLEGWIALNRDRLSLAAFSILGPQMRAEVLSEFAAMVDSGFTDDAFNNLTGVGWTHRDALLASLASADSSAKEQLARRLAGEGINARVPGVEINERLWLR